MRFAAVVPLLLLLSSGCIDPLTGKLPQGQPVLVVDGMITNEPGPYTVMLSMSSGLAGNQEFPAVVEGASVWIVDEEGQSFSLMEKQRPGYYVSDASELQGQVGKTYVLHIVTAEGTEYQSSKELLVSPGEIEDIYYEYKANSINQTDRTLPQDAITFFLDAKSEPVSGKGFLRWRSTGIYEIVTFPELRTKIEEGKKVPNPVSCSGYVNDNNELLQVDTCSCCNCWVSEYSRTAVVSNNEFADDNEFHKIEIAQVPVDTWRFFRKYYLEVEQLSISENAYEFWNRVRAQQKGTGSLFQPNAVKIKGNIRCVSDPEREVFGIFAASAIVRRSIFVTRGQLPDIIAQPPVVTQDCRLIVENSVNTRPPFW